MNTIFRRMQILGLVLFCLSPTLYAQDASYQPSVANQQARQAFADSRFGIFLHWGFWSLFGQGVLYLEGAGLDKDEYAKAATAFYPIRFDADQWVKAFKDAGAKYVCFTSRHHDGFSMFDTRFSDYNIMHTPFARDIMKELADACHREGLGFHVYYSLLDWTREDYPVGSRNKTKGRKHPEGDYDHYFQFMKNQLTEILTRYGRVDAIWLDGMWDHSRKSGFNWRLPELYSHIHKLQPACLVGNNHHLLPLEGEDFQMFEQDLPGENKTGFSGTAKIGNLPLETCQTMNKHWGYCVSDLNYKSSNELIRYIIQTAGKGANLLLNIGPQPNGELPKAALQRLKDIGQWMKVYGEAIYGTTSCHWPKQEWGVAVKKGRQYYAFLLKQPDASLQLPIKEKVAHVCLWPAQEKLAFKQSKQNGLTISLPHTAISDSQPIKIILQIDTK